MSSQFERAVVSAMRSDPDEYETVHRWLDRWQIALEIAYRDLLADDCEILEVIAPTEALNELPETAVKRYWQIRL